MPHQLDTPTTIQQLTQLLDECVKVATGDRSAVSRPGQLMLAKDIWRALQDKQRMAGVAPTGTGKSLAHMSAAALASLKNDERTVISTDSLALQAQFTNKDLPVVAEAMRELHGFTLTYAVLKGVSNYVDPVRALSLAQDLTGTKERDFETLVTLLKDGEYDKKFRPAGMGEYSPAPSLKMLSAWALSVYLTAGEAGDRDSCPINHTVGDWSLVSASSDEKADTSDTGHAPKADEAKDQALNSDIVVTNHTLLGMQAAQRIPVVFGSKRLGWFDNLIVDEAHTLPGQVRSRGAAEVSGHAIIKAGRAAMSVIEDRFIDEDAQMCAQDVDRALKQSIQSLPERDTALRIAADDIGPIGDVVAPITSFTGGLIEQLKRVQDDQKRDPVMQQKCRRAISILERLASAAESAVTPDPHVARWVTRPSDPKFAPIFESSPIDVSSLIDRELWRVAPTSDMIDDNPVPEDGEEQETPDRIPLGVACVSATLPNNFHTQARIPDAAGEYPSPFDEAYAGSAMLVPQCLSDDDVAALQGSWGGKPKFDTNMHEMWAARIIVDLVRANGGRALVLSAKASSGKNYAEKLRAALPGINVYSQWDGGQVSRIVEKWRDEESSVLVGTKSLMTGVDAKGETASLIVIDRPPRAAKNVIDEARVEDVMNGNGGNRWAADQQVYVSDAALLLDQSIGRLVRSEDDRGMCAVLDPRLLTQQWSRFTYNQSVRQDYVKPLIKFGTKFNDISAACEWLQDRRESKS